jgi:hypothetical protein
MKGKILLEQQRRQARINRPKPNNANENPLKQ